MSEEVKARQRASCSLKAAVEEESDGFHLVDRRTSGGFPGSKLRLLELPGAS
jgi:hypothetical protein